MPLLEVRDLHHGYGRSDQRTEVLRDVQLEIESGEFIAIVGYSGTGKSTLVSILAGLRQLDRGEILLRGQAVTKPGADRAVVFQNYSLMPWLTVRENVLLAIDQVHRGWSLSQRLAHAQRYLEMVGLSHAVDQLPSALSGGMRQRVSLARTLSMQPEILFLDEPLSALDALTRAQLQLEILRIWERDRQTAVLITNDVDEAMLMASRVLPLLPLPDCGATLGPSFAIPFDRPRSRKAVTQHAAYKSIKREIIHSLMTARQLMTDREASLADSTKTPEVAA